MAGKCVSLFLLPTVSLWRHPLSFRPTTLQKKSPPPRRRDPESLSVIFCGFASVTPCGPPCSCFCPVLPRSGEVPGYVSKSENPESPKRPAGLEPCNFAETRTGRSRPRRPAGGAARHAASESGGGRRTTAARSESTAPSLRSARELAHIPEAKPLPFSQRIAPRSRSSFFVPRPTISRQLWPQDPVPFPSPPSLARRPRPRPRQLSEADQIEARAYDNFQGGTFETECVVLENGSKQSSDWSASQGWSSPKSQFGCAKPGGRMFGKPPALPCPCEQRSIRTYEQSSGRTCEQLSRQRRCRLDMRGVDYSAGFRGAASFTCKPFFGATRYRARSHPERHACESVQLVRESTPAGSSGMRVRRCCPG